MNKERVLDLADRLETMDPDNFDMRQTLSFGCNTVGCIAGWAVMFYGDQDTIYDDVMGKASELLDMDHEMADELFMAHGIETEDLGGACPQAAANVLRDVARGVAPADAWMKWWQ